MDYFRGMFYFVRNSFYVKCLHSKFPAYVTQTKVLDSSIGITLKQCEVEFAQKKIQYYCVFLPRHDSAIPLPF